MQCGGGSSRMMYKFQSGKPAAAPSAILNSWFRVYRYCRQPPDNARFPSNKARLRAMQSILGESCCADCLWDFVGQLRSFLKLLVLLEFSWTCVGCITILGGSESGWGGCEHPWWIHECSPVVRTRYFVFILLILDSTIKLSRYYSGYS